MLIGKYWAILENLLTITKILLYPLDVGSSSTISMLMVFQGIFGTLFGYNWFAFFCLFGLLA